MGQGRGNARASLVGGLAIICIFLALTQPAIAAIYNVGGSNGWTFNVQNWPTAKSFRAGDVLGILFSSLPSFLTSSFFLSLYGLTQLANINFYIFNRFITKKRFFFFIKNSRWVMAHLSLYWLCLYGQD